MRAGENLKNTEQKLGVILTDTLIMNKHLKAINCHYNLKANKQDASSEEKRFRGREDVIDKNI